MSALQRFVDMVNEDKILVKNEHRAELIEALTLANAALADPATPANLPPLPNWTAALPTAQQTSIRVYAARSIREALAGKL